MFQTFNNTRGIHDTFKVQNYISIFYRQLTDDDILSMEDVNKADLLGAFTSMKKLKAMQQQIHIPNTAEFNQDGFGKYTETKSIRV